MKAKGSTTEIYERRYTLLEIYDTRYEQKSRKNQNKHVNKGILT